MLLKKKLFKSTISILLVLLLTISCLPITVSASELKVVDIEIEPITMVEYTGGYYTNENNTKYYYYEPEYLMEYVVTLSDGTVIEDYSYYFEYNDEHYYLDTVTNQSYKKQWKAGNTYTMKVSIDNITVDVPVTIAESPIATIDIKPISIHEGSNGYLNTEYGDDMETPIGEYYYYEPEYLLEYVITFKDGTEIEDYSYSFEYNDETYYFDTYTNQSFNNQWKAGNTYTITASVMGYSVEVPVTILELPFKKLEVKPVYIIDKTNGNYAYEYDSYDNLIGEYYHYYPEDVLEYTVTLNDGTVIEDRGYYIEYNDTSYYFDTFTDQSYDNQWTVGNTYEMKVLLGKLSVMVPVTITAPPIKSIEVKPITLIEFEDGYYENDYNYETDDYDLEYFKYYPEDLMEYTITLNDGSVLSDTGNGIYINNNYYTFEISNDQSYENQWKAGKTYTFEISLMGVNAEVTANIIQTPIKDIIIEPITLYKDVDSYLTTDYNPETDEYDLEYDYYSFDTFINFKILWNDGTSSTHNLFDDIIYNNRSYYASIYDDQSYYSSWKVGNTYQANFYAIGKTVTVPVTIAPSPVKNIEFIKAPVKTEYTLGDTINLNGAIIRVNYTDKTYEDVEITGIGNYFTDIYLKRFNRKFSLHSSPAKAYSKLDSITVQFLNKEAKTKISVKNKIIDSISLNGSGFDLTMEITYNDKTKQTEKVLELDPRYGDVDNDEDILERGGLLITDNNIFTAKITEDTNTGDFYLDVYLYYDAEEKIITSNKVSGTKCNWWKLQKNIHSLMAAIPTWTTNTTSYNGKVTAENIDTLLSIVCSAKNLQYFSENFESTTGDKRNFYADKVKTAFNEIFGFTPDFTLSKNYNAKNNTIWVNIKEYSNMSYNHPVKIVETSNNIKVTAECSTYLSSDKYPLTITFDKKLNLTAFNYSESDETILSGDVNNDGVINVVDATEIQKYLAGLVTFNDTQMKAADYNGDSNVSIIDATNIQKMLAGLI